MMQDKMETMIIIVVIVLVVNLIIYIIRSHMIANESMNFDLVYTELADRVNICNDKIKKFESEGNKEKVSKEIDELKDCYAEYKEIIPEREMVLNHLNKKIKSNALHGDSTLSSMEIYNSIKKSTSTMERIFSLYLS